MQVKFEVLLTSYEVLLKDRAIFKQFSTEGGGKWASFQTVIVDEAHRLKTLKSSTRDIIQNLSYKWMLLLTGLAPSIMR